MNAENHNRTPLGASVLIEVINKDLGVVIALGNVAYRNRETLEFWPEGAWVDVGDKVSISKFHVRDGQKYLSVQDFEIDCKVNS